MQMGLEDIKSEVLKILPVGGIDLLRQIFLRTGTRAEGVVADRFRGEFVDKRQILDELTPNFIVKENDIKQRTQVYRLTRIAVLVLELERANTLLDIAKHMVPLLAESWRRNGDHIVRLNDVITMVGKNRKDVIETILYFGDIQGFSAGGFNLTADENPTMMVTEQLWDSQTLESIFRNDLHWATVRISVPPDAFDVNLKEEPTPSVYMHAENEFLRKWIDRLPAPMPAILRETEYAFTNGLILIPCMGFRALLDIACQSKTRAGKNFKGAVKELCIDRKLINDTERDYLLAVYEFGSAVQHRGHQPSNADIDRALKIGVSLLRKLYDLDDEVNIMKKSTPPRVDSKS